MNHASSGDSRVMRLPDVLTSIVGLIRPSGHARAGESRGGEQRAEQDDEDEDDAPAHAWR